MALHNHLGLTPDEHPEGEPSRCVECDAPLLARRGELVIHHWAHYPDRSGTRQCLLAEGESWRHLLLKTVLASAATEALGPRWPPWRVEVPWEAEGRRYVIDAVGRLPTEDMFQSRSKVTMVEIIHSLSARYVEKHETLLASGEEVIWIFDGAVFLSRNYRWVRNQGIKHLLKPQAETLAQKLGASAFVYANNLFWSPWIKTYVDEQGHDRKEWTGVWFSTRWGGRRYGDWLLEPFAKALEHRKLILLERTPRNSVPRKPGELFAQIAE